LDFRDAARGWLRRLGPRVSREAGDPMTQKRHSPFANKLLYVIV